MSQVYNRYAWALTAPQKQAAYRAGQQDAAMFAERGRSGADLEGNPGEGPNPSQEQAPKTVLDDGSKDELTISSARDTMTDITEDEEGALIKYVGPDAYRLNNKLRRGEMLTDSEKEWTKNLDKALEKMPVYRGTIYRSLSAFGIDDVDAFIKSYAVDKVEIFPSYLSASTSVYDESFPIQYVIKSSSGRDIRAYNQSEQEILFMRDSVFRVTKVDGNTIYMEEL